MVQYLKLHSSGRIHLNAEARVQLIRFALQLLIRGRFAVRFNPGNDIIQITHAGNVIAFGESALDRVHCFFKSIAEVDLASQRKIFFSVTLSIGNHALDLRVGKSSAISLDVGLGLRATDLVEGSHRQNAVRIERKGHLHLWFATLRPQTSANNKLGEFKISGVQRAKRGEPKVEVTFALDANGILTVTAFDKVSGAQAKADIKADRGRLTDSEIERMIADAERYREEDLALARKIHLRNAFEEAVYSIKSTLTERNDIAGMSDLDDVISWIESDSESASYEQLQRKADQLHSRFGIKVDASGRMQF